MIFYTEFSIKQIGIIISSASIQSSLLLSLTIFF